MELGRKIQVIAALVFLFLLFGCFIYAFHVQHAKDKLLEENPVQSSAVIIRTFAGYKSGHTITYEFVVNGKVYHARDNYYPHLQHVDIGDTCEIIYFKNNPEISKALYSYDGIYLKIRRKNK